MGFALLWGGWLCGLLSLLAWWKADRRRTKVRAALVPAGGAGHRHQQGPTLPAWLIRLAEQLAGRGAALALSGDDERLDRLLTLAGRPYHLTPQLFTGCRLLLATAGLLVGNLLGLLGLPFLTPVLLAAAGYWGPSLWLKGRADERQRQIGRALPDFMDTVACALEAGGLSLEQALAKTAEYFRGPLGEELARVQQELALGAARQAALKGLLDRTDCRELDLLVQALLQAEGIGAPVARAFSIQAESLRNMRGQAAREAAARAESKLTVIGTLVLAPVSLLFILALMVLNLFYNPAFSGFRSMW